MLSVACSPAHLILTRAKFASFFASAYKQPRCSFLFSNWKSTSDLGLTHVCGGWRDAGQNQCKGETETFSSGKESAGSHSNLRPTRPESVTVMI